MTARAQSALSRSSVGGPGGTHPNSDEPQKPPLAGVRVLDMTVVWAGPFATVLLGDMGADLIRVESLQHPDTNTRGQPIVPPAARQGSGGYYYPDKEPGDRPWDRNAVFNAAARNKKSVTLDLMRPEGREVFFRLVRLSDVFIENNAADVVENLGITYDVLSKVNPALIMVSLPAFGQTGPYKHFKAYAVNMEGVIGHTLLRTYPDSGPTETTATFVADAAGGASAAFAILAALQRRIRTGKGQSIEMSQAENVTHYLSQAVMDYSMNHRVQTSRGNRDPSRAPQGVYPCAGEDSWVALSCGSDSEFEALSQVIGLPQDPRFTTSQGRHAHHDELDKLITAWTNDKDHYDAFHQLQQAGVPAGPVLHTGELFTDPHLKARSFWEPITHPEAGTHLYPGPIIEMTKTPLHIREPAPTLGQHNGFIYKQLLGYSDAEYARFEETDMIGDTYIVARQHGRRAGNA